MPEKIKKLLPVVSFYVSGKHQPQLQAFDKLCAADGLPRSECIRQLMEQRLLIAGKQKTGTCVNCIHWRTVCRETHGTKPAQTCEEFSFLALTNLDKQLR